MEFITDRVPSPVGDFLVVSDGTHLCALDFEDYEERNQTLLRRYYGDVTLRPGQNPGGVCDQLRRYLDGELEVLREINIAAPGTPFQQQVWQALCKIPVGHTCSYGDLAKAVGKPKASRAVGLANGANPIAVVVPCHRVIGANGTLTGYGGGLERKQWLLAHEGALLL